MSGSRDDSYDHFAALSRAFTRRGVPLPPKPLLEAARRRAEALRLTTDSGPGPLVAAAFAAEVIGGLWLDAAWSRGAVDSVVEAVADAVDAEHEIVRAAIFLTVVRSDYLYELPPKLALEAQLRMLTTFGPPTEASLWISKAGRPLECAIEVGGAPSRRARAVARQAIETDAAATTARAQLQAVPVRRWSKAEGAVVVRAPAESRGRALGYASECAKAARPLLELATLLEQHAERERSLVQTSDRRLARIGFDLHDGPMQDIAALAAEVRLYRTQLAPALKDTPDAEILLGRLDDIDARLLGMDAGLRDLARSLREPATGQTRFEDLLRRDLERFQDRSSVRVELKTTGELEVLTVSQKIALLRVVQEALNNVHEHSGSARALVRVSGGRNHLEVEIADDGSGFDVERALIEAARAGRLGLVGMSERVRLLGGQLDVESAPGGRTRVHATIPRWQPLASEDGAA